MPCAFVAWCAVAAWRPALWLVAVPALLPVANFSPWTGWLAFEEFDLLALGAIAGGYARLAWHDGGAAPRLRRRTAWLVAAFAALGAVAFCRGVADAGGWRDVDRCAGFDAALNAWRVFKPLPFALALAALARREADADPRRTFARFEAGMLAGAAVVALAVLWERAANPGLLDWGNSYRATALFWEMNVGGAAIDGYLAIAVPFVAWAVATAATPRRWAVTALLAVGVVHAVLATFARGLYLAAVGALAVLGATAPAITAAAPRWRVRANAALAAVLVLECTAAAVGGTFVRERIADAAVDFGTRVDHWRRGLGLPRGASDWLFGIGTGRVPERYMEAASASASAAPGRGHERPGAVDLVEVMPGRLAARIVGPDRSAALGGRYALAQRVVPRDGAWRAMLTLRTARPADLRVSLCEQHLLYPRQCSHAAVHVPAGLPDWIDVPVPLIRKGSPDASSSWAPPLGMFKVAVTTPGAAVEIATASLRRDGGAEALANGDFADGLAHWFPVARGYFVPWHVDSLALDLLVERGALSLAAFVALAALALRRLGAARRHGCAEASVVAAALTGGFAVGAVSSVLDMPRVAFLLLLLVLIAVR